MKSRRFTLKDHKQELIELFYHIMKQHDENTLWTNTSLVQKMNCAMAKKHALNTRQIGWIIRWQKKYIQTKPRSVILQYTFRKIHQREE